MPRNQALGAGRPERRPAASDARELVPVVPPRVEQLLLQVMEENRALRLRLEQVDTLSSWPPQGTRVAVQETPAMVTMSEGIVQSPMSFAPVSATRRVDVHSVEGAMGQDLLGQEALRVMEAQTTSAGNRAQALRPVVAAPGSESVLAFGAGVFDREWMGLGFRGFIESMDRQSGPPSEERVGFILLAVWGWK